MPPYTSDEIGFIRLLERCEAMLLSHSRAFSLGADLALKIPVFVKYLLSFIESKEKDSSDVCEFVQKHKPRVEVLNESLIRWEAAQRRGAEGDLTPESTYSTHNHKAICIYNIQ